MKHLDEGVWLFLAPIKRLRLTEAVNNEFRVNQVSFVSPQKLPRIRKRLGFTKHISELKSQHAGVLRHLFSEEEADAYAVGRLTGIGKEKVKDFLQQVREELLLLSLSQLGSRRRRHNAFPVLSQEHPIGHRILLMINLTKGSMVAPHELVGRFTFLDLNPLWKENQERGFFFGLLKILRGETRVASSWRNQLHEAAILAGQSQTSVDLPHAFLWNMIAIELLLTEEGDRNKYAERLPEMAEAFIGWTTDWKHNNYEEEIRTLYRKRNGLVHRGDRSSIETRDLLFSDVILHNVLANIVRHPRLFTSKSDVIAFSNKVKAEHLLGMRPRVRPKTFKFSLPAYDHKDFEEFF
jgi:hypothetical protein